MNTSGPAALFNALSRSVSGPASGAAASSGTGWTALISASVAFLAGSPAPGVKHPLTYELHTHVASLLLTLLSAPRSVPTTLTGAAAAGAANNSSTPSADVLHGINVADATGPDGGLAALAAAGGSISEPALRALMLLGASPFAPPQTSTGAARKSKSSVAAAAPESSVPTTAAGVPAATWASVLVAALLRNVTVDGVRSEDSDTVGPVPDSSSGKASLGIEEQRVKSLAAYARGELDGSADHAARLGAAPGAALNAVADFTSGLFTLPLGIVGKMFDDAPDPVGKPLAERSALLLLLLTHNLRAVDEGKLVKNPFREALARLVDAPTGVASYDAPLPAPSAFAAGVPVPFRALFKSLVLLCEQPLGVCLLYTLLQSSRAWCEHVLSRVDVDSLLLPLLTQLYSVPTLTPDHRYILLITLLLFTQVRKKERRIERLKSHTLNKSLDSHKLAPPPPLPPLFRMRPSAKRHIAVSKYLHTS